MDGQLSDQQVDLPGRISAAQAEVVIWWMGLVNPLL
jgi:hypothetical protein